MLAPGLDVVFVGINPGFHSDAKAAHFANPRNDFWRLLQASGLTPRLVDPGEQREVLGDGIGITNAAHRTTRGSSDLRRSDFAGSAERLERIAFELRPRALGFVGKEAYRGPFGGRPDHGLQERRLGETILFVLPSTSPANAAVPWEERLRWFHALKDVIGRERLLRDGPPSEPIDVGSDASCHGVRVTREHHRPARVVPLAHRGAFGDVLEATVLEIDSRAAVDRAEAHLDLGAEAIRVDLPGDHEPVRRRLRQASPSATARRAWLQPRPPTSPAIRHPRQ